MEQGDKKINIGELNVGNFISETRYSKIVDKSKHNSVLRLETSKGMKITTDYSIVENNCYSAHQYNEKVYLTKTELRIKFQEIVGDTIFTVTFIPQIKPADIVKATKLGSEEVMIDLQKLIINQYEKANQKIETLFKGLQKKVRAASKGVERVLIGHNLHIDAEAGRMRVIDLEKNEERWVDMRTMKDFICKNKKYVDRNMSPYMAQYKKTEEYKKLQELKLAKKLENTDGQ